MRWSWGLYCINCLSMDVRITDMGNAFYLNCNWCQCSFAGDYRYVGTYGV